MSKSLNFRGRNDVDEEISSYDPSDTEDNYSENEKMLLEKARNRRGHNNEESEEEVFGIQTPDEGSDGGENMESDLDNAQDALPHVKAWGKKRKIFYNTDYVDQDYGGFQGKDAEAADHEEQEARAIQQRLAEQLDEVDFSLDLFRKVSARKEEEKEKELIKIDLTKLSKRQKLALLQKESPEFLDIMDDFKAKMLELKENLQPILALMKEGEIPSSPAYNFVKTKYNLILNYCTNISFYLLLKAKHILISTHPIVRRLVQYRQLLKQLDLVHIEVMKPQIDSILEMIAEGCELQTTIIKSNGVSKKHKVILQRNNEQKENSEDTEDQSTIAPTKNMKPSCKEQTQTERLVDDKVLHDTVSEYKQGEELTAQTAEGKRAITYQMASNKGLIPQRKKEQRNPRVKYRKKFLKAKIRRKGQVREPRNEIKKYGGEISGIKIGVSKSIKLK